MPSRAASATASPEVGAGVAEADDVRAAYDTIAEDYAAAYPSTEPEAALDVGPERFGEVRGEDSNLKIHDAFVRPLIAPRLGAKRPEQ